MIINDPNGKAAKVTPDGRVFTLAANEPFMHAMSEIGRAWTLQGTASPTNGSDVVVFHFTNDADDGFDIHKVIVTSVTNPATWAIETGTTYSSGGGTALTLNQLNTGSGVTQDQTSYISNAITVTGTAKTITKNRIAKETQVDLLAGSEALQIGPSGTFQITCNQDTSAGVTFITIYTHGVEPWE